MARDHKEAPKFNEINDLSKLMPVILAKLNEIKKTKRRIEVVASQIKDRQNHTPTPLTDMPLSVTELAMSKGKGSSPPAIEAHAISHVCGAIVVGGATGHYVKSRGPWRSLTNQEISTN